MQLSERLPKETARDYAIRMIRDNIVKTVLEPGCMVSENELAGEMGLSRTPVREALIELGKSGIVEIFPQHGSMVSKIDYDLVEEASFTRRVLETAVVREVCGAAEERDIRLLDESVSLYRLYLSRGDADRLLAVDNEFHRRLFVIARKRLSHELMTSLSAHFDRVRHLNAVVARLDAVAAEHEAILDAVRRRDADGAERVMRDHLSRYRIDRSAIEANYARFFADKK